MGKLSIESESNESFRDRQDAGSQLAIALTAYTGKNAVVLGIPRGGIIIARELARVLIADLDVVIARKLRTPGQPELAMGSVSEGGKVFLNEDVVGELGISRSEIEEEKKAQLSEISRRRDFIRKVLPKIPLKNRIVIVTDDGVATGATFQAALESVKLESPEKLIGAVPVGSPETVRKLANITDEMVCLRSPAFFAAVGQHYRYFNQVEDDEVLRILEMEQKRKMAARK